MPTLSVPAFSRFIASIFESSGVPEKDAQLIADSLVGSDLRGHASHGVMRVSQYLNSLAKQEFQLGVDLLVLNETPAVIACDGQWGFGQVQAHRLLTQVMEKARALGIASGTACHLGHVGRLGEYSERAAGEGLVLIGTVNNDGTGQRVAPPGGKQPRLSTNPLTIGAPTRGRPNVIDFGTSVVAEGKVRLLNAQGKKAPHGWLLDSEGNPTQDPSVLYSQPSGSILPLGGEQAFKGFGLAMLLETLAAGLSGGKTAHSNPPPMRGNNILFLVLDPKHFKGDDHFRDEASQLLSYVRSSEPICQGTKLVLPGDRSEETLRESLKEGLYVAEKTWEELRLIADKLGVETCPL